MTARTDMIGEITTFSAEAFRAANRLIRDILYDTLSLDTQSLRNLYREKHTVESYQALAETFVMENDSAAAVGTLDSMPLLFELSPEDSIEHDYFKALKLIQLDIINRELSLLDLDSGMVEDIEDIVENSTGLAGVQAQGLLSIAYGYDYRLIPQLPEMSLDDRSGGVYEKKIVPSEPFVTAFPNPSTGEFTFKYKLPEELQEARLFLFDVQGRPLYQTTLNGNEGSLVWRAEGSFNGICYYKVLAGDKVQQIQKLVIVK